MIELFEARRPKPRGVTLVELMVATAITAVVCMLATQTYVVFVRDNAMRRKVASVQGDARFTLDILTREFRHASLGTATGRIWTTSGLNRVARPAVQIFSNISGRGTLDLSTAATGNALPGTDALLVVEAIGIERSATVGELTNVTAGMPRTFAVTTTSTKDEQGTPFTLSAGSPILAGDYQDASWAVLASVNSTGLRLTVTQDLILPGAQIPKLPAGSLIRRARARLYYVDTLNQLVRLDLNVPRAPMDASEIRAREVLASGIENLQIGCEMGQADGSFGSLAAVLDSGNPISSESGSAFAFATGGGPMLQADDPSAPGAVSSLRTIVFNIVARSATPIVGSTVGDPRIPLDGVTLGDPSGAYVRRAYQLAVGVRNTSLGDI